MKTSDKKTANFEVFKATYEHKPVEEYPNRVVKGPLVSVSVITYNHARYIRQCLDGILMQKTNFPFEIVLGEDGSTDGTREICIEYAKKYPRKIRLLLHHRENNIKIDGNPTSQFNSIYLYYKSNGKYIALCEGDDYWTDPLKLQKQASFLESNPEFSVVAGGFKEIDEKTGYSGEVIRFRDKLDAAKPPSGYSFTLKDTLNVWLTKTLTVMYRKKVVANLVFTQYRYLKDVHWYYHILKNGRGFYMTSILGVYRMHDDGAYSSLQTFSRLLSNFYPYQELYQLNRDDYTRLKYLRYINKILSYYKDNKIKNKNPSKISLIKAAFQIAKNKLEFLRSVKLSLPLINKIKLKPIISIFT
jgi:glycosyltransferase involved in cell wall biosynthesis